jgi:prevent-host-death family protein
MTVSISEASRNLSHLVNQASYGRECVMLTSRGRPKAVIIGMETFEMLLGVQSTATAKRLPVDQLRQELRQALAAGGYRTKEEIVALVQDVKRELADERVVDSAGVDE